MSSAELILILIVAIVVFGPSKLPMLASHISKMLKIVGEGQQKISVFWQSQLYKHQLEDNLKKAEKADNQYESKE